MITKELFKMLLPAACSWAEEQEQFILKSGVALSEQQLADAKRVGVTHPEKVRLLSVRQVPMPKNPMLQMAIRATNALSADTIGLTLRYGIFIREDQRGQSAAGRTRTGPYEAI